MTNKDLKELGLPLYEDIVRAFKESDHYNICHRTDVEWTDGAEWVRRIAVGVIRNKEKEMIDKACKCFCDVCGYKECAKRNVVCTEYKEFRKALEE